MARPLRISFPGALYHVTARGNAQQPIVRDDVDRSRFVERLAETSERHHVRCYAWVLMGNHYHLLVETPEANVSAAVHHLNGVYSQAFNRRHARVGHLFQGRFKSIVVERRVHLLELCRYVVLNPVRAGLVAHPSEWRWSSYRATVGEEPPPPWLEVDWVLAQFGRARPAARAAYREFVAAGIHRGTSPWSAVRGQVFLGSEAFVAEARSRAENAGDLEIPSTQRLAPTPELERLLSSVAEVYETEVAHVLRPARWPTEARQVAVYLARRAARLPLKTVAGRFGMHYGAVSRAVRVLEERLAGDAALRARLAAIVTPGGRGGRRDRLNARPDPGIVKCKT